MRQDEMSPKEEPFAKRNMRQQGHPIVKMLDLHRWLAGGRWENEARVELGEAAMSGQFLEQRSSDEVNYSMYVSRELVSSILCGGGSLRRLFVFSSGIAVKSNHELSIPFSE
jgi:hypothetical protein